jgi:hypothetical protein
LAAFPTPLTIDINYDIILFIHPAILAESFFDFMKPALAGFV